MDNQNCESSDTVTLVLRDCRVQANKYKLARNSRYFASLFSENFKDHRQKEFAINYEISLQTLNDFIEWANNEGESSNSIDSIKYKFTVNKSLEKFVAGNRSELLQLLEVSVIFIAEKLTEDIVEMIVYNTHVPTEDLLETWLLAEHLGLKTLEDIALANCLDRFDELTTPSLVALSPENFTKLVCNVNVRSSVERLMNLREAWIERNGLATNMPDFSSRFVKGEPEDVIAALKKAKPHHVQCMVGHKSNEIQVIYLWNGETLREFAEIGREIQAKQVLARGLNIYVVGLKKGVDKDDFNTTIWRYCVFTKKWYIETILPRPREKMGVTFLENKLYLFGGVGPNGNTISAVDVYNVYTGVWSTAADFPVTERPTRIRSSCVVDGKILYRHWKSDPEIETHLYDPLVNKWKILHESAQRKPQPVPRIRRCAVRKRFEIQFLLGAYEKVNISKIHTELFHGQAYEWYPADDPNVHRIEVPVIYMLQLSKYKEARLKKFALACEQYLLPIKVVKEWSTKYSDTFNEETSGIDSDIYNDAEQQVMNGSHVVSFGYGNGRANVEVGEVNTRKSTYNCLKTYSQELRDVPDDCFQRYTGCFNLVDPDTLHTTITVPI